MPITFCRAESSHASLMRKAKPGTRSTGELWIFPGWQREESHRSLGPCSSREVVTQLQVGAAESAAGVGPRAGHPAFLSPSPLEAHRKHTSANGHNCCCCFSFPFLPGQDPVLALALVL